MRELLARIKALLRRVRLVRAEAMQHGQGMASARKTASLDSQNLRIDVDRREVTLDGRVLALRPKEYELLLFLVRNKGMVLSRDLILERVWDWEYSGESRTVDVHVRWLREKIETDPGHPVRIVTIRGIGYRFER